MANKTSSGSDADTGAIIVLLYVVAVILPIGFDIGSLAMSMLRLVLIFVFVPLTIGLFSGRYGKVYPVDYLLFLHALWVVLSISINNPDRVIENGGANALEFLGGYVVGRTCIRSPAAFYSLIRMMLGFAILSIPFALVESQTGTAILVKWIDSIPGISSVVQIDVPPRMGLHRSQVVFAHPIHYGLFCTAALSLTWIGMRSVMGGTARVMGSMTILLAVFLSLSSGALLAALLQIGLISWNFMLRNNPKRWLILVGIFAFIYVVIDLASNRTPIRVFMSYATFSAHNAFYRAIIFEWGMINVWDNPFVGLGLRRWVRPGFMRSGSIDNFWLVMAVKFGIPGFLLIAAGYADAMIRVARTRLTPGSAVSDLRLAWMFTFVGLTFTLATVHIWTSIFSFVFFLLGAGLWMVNATDEDGAGARVAANPADARNERRTMWSRQTEPVMRREGVSVTLARDGAKDMTETPPESATARYTRFAQGGHGNDGFRRSHEEDGK
ncbi:MAG: O-antigen ligase family protein [Albidovulum sp.]|uniref:O-antigen ligase family protein n=1 Tax=Albidovulum sp. TaxID=1872424 RepID=UPI003CAD9976